MIFKKNKYLVAFYDTKHKELILTKHKYDKFQDIYYHQEHGFIFFHPWEKSIVLQKYKSFIKSSDPKYYIIAINFLDNGNIVLLETREDDHKVCRLGIYEIIS